MTIFTASHNQLNLPIQQIATFDIVGEDAAFFLQGQLTQDMLHWQANEIKRAAWCNAKGRMLASFYVWQINNGFRLLVAKDLVAKLLPRLRLFVLRAKVSISEPLAIDWFITHSHQPCLTHTTTNDTIQGVNSLNAHTTLNLLPKTEYTPYALALSNHTDTNGFKYSEDDWNLAHIQTGTAWINASNTEQFIPQTANFELVNGVNFRKGCYPGQEIVARSQYLGKLKQRAFIATFAEENTQLLLNQYLLSHSVDIFDNAQINNPIGKIILLTQTTTDTWILFTSPRNAIDSNTTLYIAVKTNDLSNQTVFSSPIHLKKLPYFIIDVTN
jgi:tRNA-modifying protein YgfZ